MATLPGRPRHIVDGPIPGGAVPASHDLASDGLPSASSVPNSGALLGGLPTVLDGFAATHATDHMTSQAAYGTVHGTARTWPVHGALGPSASDIWPWYPTRFSSARDNQ